MGKLYNFIERMTFKARIIGRELSGKCIPINSYAWMDYNGATISTGISSMRLWTGS